MKVKINETMKERETFIFDIVKYSEKKHIIPQNGEYTLTDNMKYENKVGKHDVQIFIQDNGYLMIDP